MPRRHAKPQDPTVSPTQEAEIRANAIALFKRGHSTDRIARVLSAAFGRRFLPVHVYRMLKRAGKLSLAEKRP